MAGTLGRSLARPPPRHISSLPPFNITPCLPLRRIFPFSGVFFRVHNTQGRLLYLNGHLENLPSLPPCTRLLLQLLDVIHDYLWTPGNKRIIETDRKKINHRSGFITAGVFTLCATRVVLCHRPHCSTCARVLPRKPSLAGLSLDGLRKPRKRGTRHVQNISRKKK